MNADSKTCTPDAEEQAAMVDAIEQMMAAPDDAPDKEACGWCGEELDCFGLCDCPGAIADRTPDAEEGE